MGTLVIQLLGGLGLFVFGMNLMSRGIEKVAGNKLRGILEAFTKNKFLGLIVGLFFTAVIQSSSAATVMVVGFVNSGLMTLGEACGVILGANIGTTVTAMLVAFRLSTVAPLFVFAGMIMLNFIKKPTIKKSGEIVLGFGLLFMGISTMSSAMGALKEIPAVIDLLGNFTNPLLGVLLGLLLTSVVQSSSVTVSILVVMASQGLVDLHICMFVILGCNIGACTSALLASLGGTKNAKRAALIHLLFNIYGTVLMFVLLLLFGRQIEQIIYFFSGHGTDAGNLGRNIAMAHFLFKVFQVVVFYPFMNLIVRCTYKLVPGEDAAETGGNFKVQFISGKLPNPAVAILMAVQEMERMANMAIDNLNLAVNCLIDHDVEKSKQISDELHDIPVVIMAGGKGTRLQPYTNILPKALIPIGEVTITERIIESFQKYGAKKFYLILNHKANMIKSYFNEVQKNYDLEYIEEKEFLGTGGGLSLLKGKIEGSFFLSNCDILINGDLECICRTHKREKNKITFVCAMKDIVIPYGVIETDNGGKIISIKEKPEFSFLTNTGVYMIESEVIHDLKENEMIHLPDIAKRYIQKGEKVGVFPVSEKAWMDMGQFSEMETMMKQLGV